MNRANARAILEKQIQETTSHWDRLPILIELTKEPTRNDPDAAHRYAQEALALAMGLNDQFWIACSHNAIGISLLRTARYSEVLYHLQKASSIFKRINDPCMKARTDFHIARTYIFTGKFNEAMALLAANLTVFESMEDPYWIAHTLCSIADVYKGVGNHSKGLEHYRRALKIVTDAKLDTSLGYIYQDLAFAYRQIGDYKRSHAYLFKCLAAHREHDMRSGMAVAMGNIARGYIEQGMFSRAEKYVRQSGRIYRELGYTFYEAISWGRLIVIYGHRGDFAHAQRCFKKGIILTETCEDTSTRGRLYQQFGMVCIKEGKIDRGLVYLKKALKAMVKTGYTHYQYEVHQDLAAAYEKGGYPDKALEHHKEYIRLKSEYINAQKIVEASRAEVQDELARLTESLKKEQSTINSLKQILEEKETKLMALTLQLVQEESRIVKSEKSIGYRQETPRQRVSDNWEAFAGQFHKVHQGFYTDLIQQYPELTTAEVKVCSLIRIGLSSKEMASILGVSKRTIDSHREHIRKKLNLSSRLVPFIKSL